VVPQCRVRARPTCRGPPVSQAAIGTTAECLAPTVAIRSSVGPVVMAAAHAVVAGSLRRYRGLGAVSLLWVCGQVRESGA